MQTDMNHFSIVAPLLKKGQFQFQTLEEAYKLADFLSLSYPDPNLAKIGISELLVNAVEHGNLGITSIEKTTLQTEGRWLSEIHRRLKLTRYRHKKVTVFFKRTSQVIELIIRDQGIGFEWKNYVNPGENADINTGSNGRGILMAQNLVFTRLIYSEKGNEVKAYLQLLKKNIHSKV